MGLFDNTQKTTSQLKMPSWLEGAPQEVKNRTMDLLTRESLSPEQRVAELDPAQQNAISQMIGWGGPGGGGSDILQSIMGGIGGYEQGQNILGDLATRDIPQNMGIDMDYVNSLINNDVLGDQIQAATRDVERRFSEVDAPMSRLNQALSGGTGSTRGAIGDALLQRGAEDRAGDIAAGMRGQAFGQALGLGGQRAAQNPALELQGMATQGAMGGNLARLGLTGSQLGQNIGLQNIGLLNQGGGMNRAYEQALRNVEYQNWQRQYGDVELASGIFNEQADVYGKHKTKQTSKPSPFSIGTAMASTAMGMPPLNFGDPGSFDFSQGGFFNPSSDYLNPGNVPLNLDLLPVS